MRVTSNVPLSVLYVNNICGLGALWIKRAQRTGLIDRTCKIVDRNEHGGKKSSDAEAEKHNHERLDESDKGVDRIRYFASIELPERVKNVAKLARLLTHAYHGHQDTGDFGMLSQRI